jgi:Flp pilus assembly protein TadD
MSVKHKWPGRGDPDNRIEPICLPELNPRFRFERRTSIFTIGSCFARNIEEYLQRLGMDLPTMAFSAPPSEFPAASRTTGLLNKYTPPAILSELRFALDPAYGLALDDHFIDAGDGTVIDLHLPSYAAVGLERARERRLEIQSLFQRISGCELVIITLGLIECWKDLAHDTYIAQQPPPRTLARNRDRFVPHRLDFATSFEMVEASVKLILSNRPGTRILLTTSPVPLNRTFTDQDVITANAYSKSVLRTVCEEIRLKHPEVDYFPSYETVTLTDRALAWADDLRHVRDEVVGRIVERVSEAYFGVARETDPRADYAEARVLLSAGDNEQALKRLEAVREALAGDKQFLADLGTAYLQADRLDEAIAALEAAVALDPEIPKLQLLLARAYRRSGDVANARAVAETLLGRDANHLKALALLARLDLMSGDEGAAFESLRTIAETRPRHLDEEAARLLVRLARLRNDAKTERVAVRRLRSLRRSHAAAA